MALRLVIILSLFVSQLNAQNFVGFNKKISSYPQDIRQLFGPNLSQEDENLVSNFIIDWKTNAYDSIEKTKILDISIKLFDHKGRIPHFKLLLQALTAFKDSIKKEDNQNYNIWLEYMTEYLSNKKISLTAMSVLLENIAHLVRENVIYSTSTSKWKYNSNNYVFQNTCPSFCITFPKGALKCYSIRDSIEIDGTSGSYDPMNKTWSGTGGEVTWERAGYKESDVNAKLKTYAIDMTRTEYKADSVTFTCPKYFSSPVQGKLTDKVTNVTGEESASYPVYNTYNNRFVFKNLYPNLDYEGGFSMRGSKIIGSGNDEKDAKIFIRKGDKILMQVTSKYFVFRPTRVNGIKTSVKIYLEKDSIYHSDLSFTYHGDIQEVNLMRTDNYSSQGPYYNSYHKLNMNFEQLIWRINEPKIRLTMPKAAAIGKARFESQNFFNRIVFDDLQGRDEIHPLIALRRFSRQVGSDQFTASRYADFVGRSLNYVHQVLMEMTKKGYIYYNDETDLITIRQRLIDCIKSAAGSIDYDVVSFNSETQAPLDNAELDMDNYDLVINGITNIAVSDSQNVMIFPARDQIIMKQDRSFQFDGKINAGLFTFYGSNFFFDYKNFKINLQNVDSVSINVYTGEYDQIGRPITRNIKNVIQHLTGELRIDKPDNKSGLKSHPNYPMFASRENSFVYYQSHDIENGVYPQSSFYFELYPFEIDSLDNFKNTGLNFRGKFRSSGILPDLEQNLTLQPDLSLGFQFNPGTEGIPVYGGKGMVFGKVQLSNKGLRADGKMKYVTSTTTSKDFKFYPDSMNTLSDEFVIERQITDPQFPKVTSKQNYIHWATGKNNFMQINQGKEPFSMFNPQTFLSGKLILDPKTLSGKGLMNLTTAELGSKHFRYKAENIDADTARFLLKSLKKEGYTVLTEENVNSHIDFSVHKGEFIANEDYTKVEFPENKYISYLDYFKWNMEDKTLEMSAKRTNASTQRTDKLEFEKRFRHEEEPEGPRYISVQHKQDSLNFVAPNAVYDYQANIINASDVKLIRVADAIIYPADGKLSVMEGAQMKTINNAKISADYLHKYHLIHSADVNITSRINFTGKGKYDYVDENEKVQVIDMSEIGVDDQIHTIAKGTILEQDTFTLSPYFGFQGKVTLASDKPLLYFDGGTKILANCVNPKYHWLKFESEIDPKAILIPISDEPVNINNARIYSGIFLASDSIHIYSAYTSGRRTYSDRFITTSSGFLRFNKDSMTYEIASKDRLQYPDSLGNYLSMHHDNCTEYGEGKINLGMEFGQMKISSFGSARMNIPAKEVSLNVMLNVDFFFDPASLQTMANRIDSFPKLDTLNMNRPLVVKALRETMGKAAAAAYLQEISTLKKPKEFPAVLEHTISFTSLNLNWDQASHTFYSTGKIGVGSILNHQVNRMVDGYVQMIRKNSGDIMDIYLKLDDKNFYYFGYTRGAMQVYSSNLNYLNIIRSLPLKIRMLSVKSGETPYTYLVSSDSRFGNFLRDYRRIQRMRENKEKEVPEAGSEEKKDNGDNAQTNPPQEEQQDQQQQQEVIPTNNQQP